MKKDNNKDIDLFDWEDWKDEDTYTRKRKAEKEDVSLKETISEADEISDSEEDLSSEEDDELDEEVYAEATNLLQRLTNPHIIFAIAVFLILLIVVIKLIRWNIGTESGYDPNNLSTEYDTEALDVIFKLTPDLLEGHVDDGKETILFLGNDPLSDDRDSDEAFTALVSESLSKKLDVPVTVYNASFEGSTISNADAYITDETLTDMFNLYWIARGMTTSDFSLQDNAITIIDEKREEYEETLSLLKELDYSTIDTLVIFYDALDYQKNRPVMDEQLDNNTATYTGAMSATLDLIQEKYPFIRIIIMSPSYNLYLDEDGKEHNGDTHDLGNGSMPTYLLKLIDIAQHHDVSIIDNYYGTINEDNYKKYLDDHIHYNEEGRKKLADRLTEVLAN